MADDNENRKPSLDWRVAIFERFTNASVGVVAIIVFGYVLNKQADNQAAQTQIMRENMEAQTRAIDAISRTYTGR